MPVRGPNMRYCRIELMILVLVGGLVPALTAAQHPIDVQRQLAAGDYYSTLVAYERMPKRKATPAAVIAAGKAAWALSLPDRAVQEFDTVLRDQQLGSEERARLLLSRGVIEFQEDRYQVAILFAEKAVLALNTSSSLRAKAWLLWGEALSRLDSHGAAEQKYFKALEEEDEDGRPDINFRLGECQLKLGKLSEARANFELLPLGHEQSAAAIRHLSGIALDEGRYDQAAFWLKKGREQFPEAFLDSWVDYALLKVAVSQNDSSAVRQIKSEAEKRYPPSDHWLTLLQAAAENYQWRQNSDSGNADS